MEERKDIQEEIFSKSLRCGRRTYFFDVRSTKAGDYYLTITESKRFFNEDGTSFWKKHKIYLYKEDFKDFEAALSEMVKFIFDNKGEEVIPGENYRQKIQENKSEKESNEIEGDSKEKESNEIEGDSKEKESNETKEDSKEKESNETKEDDKEESNDTEKNSKEEKKDDENSDDVKFEDL